MNEKLFEALDEAIDETVVVTEQTVADAEAQLAALEANIQAQREELAKLEAQTAQLRAANVKVGTNAHLANKTQDELFAGVKGLPVQVKFVYGNGLEVIAPCEQTEMTKYGTKNVEPGMSLQSSDVIMQIEGWGPTRFLFQGKLVLHDQGK